MEKARNTEEEKKMGQKWVKKEYEASETRINTGFPADTSTSSVIMYWYQPETPCLCGLWMPHILF